MLTIFRRSATTGVVTGPYPEKPDPMPAGARGTPELIADRCRGHAACEAVCPSHAITLTPSPPRPPDHYPQTGDPANRLPDSALDVPRVWQIDYGRCVFCGLCAEVCPEDAIAITGRYELAARRREDLVVRVPLRGARAPTPSAVPAQMTDIALAARLRRTIQSAFRRSLHIRHLDAGSDNAADWELTTLLGPIYDVQRLGIDFVASPRHADLLAVTGPVTHGLERAVRETYAATPSPKLVVAVGTAACGGDVIEGSYAVAPGSTNSHGGVDRIIPVDVYIPGDPPRPQAIIYGLLLALGRASPRTTLLSTPAAAKDSPSAGSPATAR